MGDGARRGRRFHPLRSILAEIYLCHTSSCHEKLRTETPGRAAVRTGGVGARIITCRKHRCSAAGVTAVKGKAGAERAAVAAGHQCGGIGVERRLHILVGAAGRSDQLGGVCFVSWAGRVLSVEREGGGGYFAHREHADAAALQRGLICARDPHQPLACTVLLLPGRFHPQYLFLDKNRRDIGKSQSKCTAYKVETPGSQRVGATTAADDATAAPSPPVSSGPAAAAWQLVGAAASPPGTATG
eukprot:COSAG01_NODE_1232_length_11111_cov_24.710770_1_plen_242_part_10